MEDIIFFNDLVASVPLPIIIADFLLDTYVTRKAFYKDIDNAGPHYSPEWKETGLLEYQLQKLRLSAIRLREEKRKNKQCVIS